MRCELENNFVHNYHSCIVVLIGSCKSTIYITMMKKEKEKIQRKKEEHMIYTRQQTTEMKPDMIDVYMLRIDEMKSTYPNPPKNEAMNESSKEYAHGNESDYGV